MKIEDKEGKLVITDFDEVEAYEIASAIEKEGIRFYTELKNQQKDNNVKEMLEFMVQDEKNHLKFFEAALVDLEAKLERPDEDNDLVGSMNFGIFQPYESIENLNDVINDNKKALKLGLVSEEKAINFYHECKNKVSSQETKKELDKIISEEQKHKALFEKKLQELS